MTGVVASNNIDTSDAEPTLVRSSPVVVELPKHCSSIDRAHNATSEYSQYWNCLVSRNKCSKSCLHQYLNCFLWLINGPSIRLLSNRLSWRHQTSWTNHFIQYSRCLAFLVTHFYHRWCLPRGGPIARNVIFLFIKWLLKSYSLVIEIVFGNKTVFHLPRFFCL